MVSLSNNVLMYLYKRRSFLDIIFLDVEFFKFLKDVSGLGSGFLFILYEIYLKVDS